MTIRIEPLAPTHNVAAFTSGVSSLDEWLQRYGLATQRSHGVRVYVAVDPDVVGFYALAAGSVEHASASDRVSSGLARHPIPVVILARLAVARSHQRQGLGASLLIDAVRRTLRAADEIGIRALLVDAKDQTARAFYEHFGFVASPTGPQHLIALIKDLEAL